MPTTMGSARPDEADAVEQLLRANGLPVDGVRDCLPLAIVAREGTQVVGCAALEMFKSGVLLRSVVVDAAHRGQGLGEGLVDEVLVLARSKGATSAYLLTTTAAEFFAGFGFEVVEREAVPADVRQSVEFVSACPSTATVMKARITGHVW